MPRNYVPKKKRQNDPPNPWRRKRRSLGDPEPGEPHLADFFRHEVPTFLTVADWVHELGLGEGARITVHEITKAIYIAALVYRQAQGIQRRIDEYSELKRDGDLPMWAAAALKVRGKGQPRRLADEKLIIAASQLLQKMKGHNAPIGWGHWDEKGGTRKKSEIQIFVELLLALIDPCRQDLPPARYYSEVKKKIGLVTPR
jgi:hypothetical protein